VARIAGVEIPRNKRVDVALTYIYGIGPARAKEALEAAIAQGIMAGEVVGKNAEEREAKARSLYPALFQALLEAEEELTRAKFRLEVAKARAREVEVLAGLAADGDKAVVLE